MTDRELIELAAKAAGIELMPEVDWNPLESDADAFRLAVKLRIRVWGVMGGGGEVGCLMPACDGQVVAHVGDDEYAATRRAITRAAAEIGKGMGEA